MATSKDLPATPAKRSGGAIKKGPPPAIKGYLILYNVASLIAWGTVLYKTCDFLLASQTTRLLATRVPPVTATSKLSQLLSVGASKLSAFSRVATPASVSSLPEPLLKLSKHLTGSYDFKGLGPFVVFTQSAAILEVVHALVGWVRSDVVTVAMQVASRLWMVWGIVEQNVETHSHPLFTTMVLAWSVTEVIRYGFYACNLIGIGGPIMDILSWLRYNTFYILYPLGAGSEAFLMSSTLPSIQTLPKSIGSQLRRKKGIFGGWKLPVGGWNVRDLAVGGLFVGWWPALYVLFTHMMRLRRKVMGKGRTLGGTPGSTKKTQ